MKKLLKNSLRTRVLVPLGLLLAVMIAALLYASHVEEDTHALAEAEQSFHAVQRYYDTALATHTQKLSAALAFIVSDPALTHAFRSRDRNTLRQLATPLLQRLHAGQQVTHFYFLTPDRTTLLRVHEPSRHGDIIQRHSALEAARTGKPAAGVELGPLGTFTLRVVFPWHANGELIGYVELGEEVEPILEQIKEISKEELLVAIDKQFLDQNQWIAGMRLLGRHAKWGQFPAYVITFGTSPETPPGLANAFATSSVPTEISKTVSHDNHLLRTTFVPLTEAGGRKVGVLLLTRDVTARFDSSDKHIAMTAVAMIAAGSAMLAFFYLLLGRVDRNLGNSRLALIAAAEQREAEQARHIQELEREKVALHEAQGKLSASELRLEEAQRIAHLGNWEWDIKSGTLFWSEEIYRIFGLAPDAFSPTYESFLHAIHPNDREAVKDAVNHTLYENIPYHIDHRITLPDGAMRIVHERGELICNERGEPVRMVGTVQDITTRKMTEEQLNFLAYFDGLTGLPNRTLFADRLAQNIIEAGRHGRLVAVMLLDIDHFKNINDTMGHESGDLLLKAAADRMAHCVREGDTVARLGGDEFAIILNDVAYVEDVGRLAQKSMQCFDPPFSIAGSELFASASIGITLFPTDGDGVDILLQNADSAMYFAKEQGRNNYQFYAPEMTAHAKERFALEASLRHALEKNELQLYYQPQISSASGRITGIEALLRWQRPEEGLTLPGSFIPLAEETGLIVPIGEWVLRTACVQLNAWDKSGIHDMRVAVNLSLRQFKQNNLAHTVANIIQETGIDPSRLELEITESMLADSAVVLNILVELKALGVTISIDDFGTGYSSLSYLKRFPIDTLKIDQAFVRDVTNGGNDAALVRAIIAMARSLKLSVIAEGVETGEHADFLKQEGCDEMQGFYFARPMTAETATEFIKKLNA